MTGAPPFEKIEFFLRSVFDYLDRYTEFTERPMADERSWIGVNAPIVQLIFLDDVVNKRRIEAHYVTLFITGQVFTLEQYVDACVKVLQSLREEDLPDVVIEYTNMLVEVYAQSIDILNPPPEPAIEGTGDLDTDLATALKLDDEETVRTDSDQNHVEPPPPEKPYKDVIPPVPGSNTEDNRGWS